MLLLGGQIVSTMVMLAEKATALADFGSGMTTQTKSGDSPSVSLLCPKFPKTKSGDSPSISVLRVAYVVSGTIGDGESFVD